MIGCTGIECSNQNAAFGIAILVLTLGGDHKALDIAVGIPILYSLWNYVVILVATFIFQRVGYLKTDELDKAITFRKLILQWRESKKGKGDKEELHSVEKDPEEAGVTMDSVHSTQSSTPKQETAGDAAEYTIEASDTRTA